MDKLIKRIAFVALLLAGCAVHAHAAAVQIVIPADNAAMLNLARAARHALLQVEPTLQVDIGSSVDNVNVDTLLIPIGDDLMAKTSIAINRTQPTLFFYVSSTAYYHLPPHNDQTALFRDQPLIRQLQLTALLLPNARRALVLHRGELPEINSIKAPPQLTVEYRDVSTDNDWIRNMARWVQQHNVLIGIDDRELYNQESIRSILLTTYRQGKVLIGPDRGFVNAGSLASTYSTPEQYLHELQLMVQTWLQSRTLPPATSPRDFQLAVNRQVADSLGLRLQDDKTLLLQLQKHFKKPGAP